MTLGTYPLKITSIQLLVNAGSNQFVQGAPILRCAAARLAFNTGLTGSFSPWQYVTSPIAHVLLPHACSPLTPAASLQLAVNTDYALRRPNEDQPGFHRPLGMNVNISIRWKPSSARPSSLLTLAALWAQRGETGGRVLTRYHSRATDILNVAPLRRFSNKQPTSTGGSVVTEQVMFQLD